MDWENIYYFASEDTIQTLQSSKEFSPLTNRREQYVRMDIQHHPVVPVSMIGRLFGVRRDTIQWHYKTDVAKATTHHANGRPSILTREEHNDLITLIAEAQANNHVLMTDDVGAYFARLAETIEGLPADFVSNMEEMGYKE
jgi:hypothetical protein